MNKNFKFHTCNTDAETRTLEELLKALDSSLFEKWISCKAKISAELRKRYETAFPDGAADPVLHPEQCVSLMARILNKDHTLTAEELFLLLVATYIHDMGMVSQEAPFVPTQPHLNHFEVSQNIVLTAPWLPLSSEEREIVGFLCRWHNKELFIKSGTPLRFGRLLALMHLCDDYHKIVDVLFFVR